MTRPLAILLFGKGGQVGSCLLRQLTQTAQSITALDATACDLSNPAERLQALRQFLAQAQQHQHPPLILNAAAYTAVDKAESERDLCAAINHQAVRDMAHFAADHAIPLIHYSTDYVYDGQGDTAFTEEDTHRYAPQNWYGECKLQGDLAIQASGCQYLILRTSWVYHHAGHNFLKTMLRLGQERPTLSVVADQVGSPTYAPEIARTTLTAIPQWLANPALSGIYHCTTPETMSWYDFAQAIFTAARIQQITLAVQQLTPIPTTAYPTPASRPHNSRLSVEKLRQNFGITHAPVATSIADAIGHLRMEF